MLLPAHVLLDCQTYKPFYHRDQWDGTVTLGEDGRPQEGGQVLFTSGTAVLLDCC